MDEQKEYQELLEALEKYVEEVGKAIHSLKVENRKLRTFLRTELVRLTSDHMALGRKIDGLAVEEPEVDSHVF
jgi:hypothetical protein